MNNQSLPKLLLATAAAAALSSHQAIAQNPAAAAARSGAGAAQTDQIKTERQMAEVTTTKADAVNDASLTISQAFEFKPPTTKTRLGLTKDEQEKLNDLGAKLVSFVDEAENIESQRKDLVEKLSEEATKRKDEADQRLRDARIANRDAATDLLGAKRDEKRAKDDFDKKWKERADITEELNRRHAGNVAISEENAERKDRIEKAKEEVSRQKLLLKEAEEHLDKAKSEEKALAKQLDDNEKAFTSATNEVAKSQASLQKSKESEKTAEEDLRSTIKTGEENIAQTKKAGEENIAQTKKAGEENIAQTRKAGEENIAQTRKTGEEAVAMARQNGEKALHSAKDEASAALLDKVARDKEEKAAASAKRAAEKSKSGADRAVKKAEGDLQSAKINAVEAREALAEAQRKDQETKGWFARLFIPSVDKAQRRLRKAEMAIGKADGEKKLADARAAKAAEELARAGKKFDASKAAATAAGKELEAKETAVADAKRKLGEDVAAAQGKMQSDVADAKRKLGEDVAAAQGKMKSDVADAKRKRDDAVTGARKKLEDETAVKNDELAKARQGVANAENVLRDSKKDAAQKKDAVEDTKDDLASATREVGRSERTVEKHGDYVDEAETKLKAIEAEGGNPLEFVKESELKDQVQGLNHVIRDLQGAKDKAEQTVTEKDAALKRSEDGLKGAREAFSIAEAKLSGVADEALEKATKAEEERQGKIEANANDFWNKFIVRAERDAPNFVKVDPQKLRDDLEAAAAARKARDTDFQNAERDCAAAKTAFGTAEKAVADAEKAAKAAVAAAKDEAAKEKARKEGDAAVADARAKVSEARKAFGEAQKVLDNAKKAFADAKAQEAAALKAANSYDGELKGATSRVLADAEKLKKAFYAAVEEAREVRREEKRRRRWSESRKRHMAAIDALNNYRKAKKDYDAAEKEYAAIVHETRDVQEMAGWKQNPDVTAARKKRIDARATFKNAEAAYNQYYSDANTFRTASLSDDEALKIVKRYEKMFKEDYGKALEFDGDRLWLARTSVNGIPLMQSFFDEMEWQADNDENVANTTSHAEEAAKYVRERAIYGGFYFAGLDVSEAKGEENPKTGDAAEKLVVFVDKGRFGPTTVEFVAPQANGEDRIIRDTNNVPVIDGRAFRRSDIISRFLSRDAETNDLERQAFNFIEFRKNFNALNADPDIRKANVEFSVARPDFEYDYDYGDTNARPARVSRAILTKMSVDENPSLINRILPRPIAPIHGVLAVDNFNSMGEFDQLGVEDLNAWMARLTLQHQHRLLGRDAALTLNGNYSFGGAIYGGAASYFLARPEDRGWADGGWRDWALTAHGGYTDVDQEDVIEGLDVLGTGYYGGLQASTRLVDTVTSALDFSLGLTYRYVENSVRIHDEGRSDVIPLGPNGGDGYTILPLSAALMYSDKQLDALNGRNYATVEAIYNLGGSTVDELKAFRTAIEDNRYLLIRAQLARIQLLGSDSTAWWMPRILFARADAQWASTPVIGAEQYGLGGHGTVRGYVEREFMGDSGVSGTIEFRTPINLLSIFSDVPANPYQAADKLQLVYFADGGWFTLTDGLGKNEDESEFIASLGAGLRYAFRDLIFRFDWGFPLVRDDASFKTSSAGTAHLSLQYQF